MIQPENETLPANNIWTRGLFMVLLGLFYSLSGTVLFVVAVLQFIFVLIGSGPNARLRSFGHHLGMYVQRIADFLSFHSEDKPFPFSDWPS
jgi:hypothetical protein